MLTYVMVVASVALLGLFVDENRLSLSIKLAVLYGGLMILIGLWQGWPAQLVSGSALFAPIWFFIASRITARFVPEADKRFQDIPLIMYFSLNLTQAMFFAMKGGMGL